MMYKIWMQIEEIFEDRDHYENVGEPEELACCGSLEEAESIVASIIAQSQST